jgi:outer membrane protein assembly factor BamA
MVVDSTGNYYYTYQWSEFFTKLAVAFGVGLRYETPVGPIRVDFGLPFYDPMRKTDQFIFQRTGALKTIVFHIALGNAF